jgi:hypothetical protein
MGELIQKTGYGVIKDILTVFVILSYQDKLKCLDKVIDYADLKLVVAFVISNHIQVQCSNIFNVEIGLFA